MLCANELLMKRRESIMEWEEKREKALDRMLSASIELCETKIGAALEAQASDPNGGLISISLKFEADSDAFDNEVLYLIVRDGKTYADGDYSYSPCTDKRFHRFFIEEYLTKHCLSVKWEETTYKRFHFGTRKAYRLIVKVE